MIALPSFITSALAAALSFLQAKGLLLGGAGLILLAAVGVQSCRLDAASAALKAETLAHNATRRDLALTKGLWLVDQRSANATILGLQKQINGTLADFAAYRAEEIRRGAIARAVAPRPRTEKEKAQVVDDETRRRAVDFLNAW
jgi:hypothetical protein